MQDLNDLINSVLEHGIDAQHFEKILVDVSKLQQADALVVWLRALSKNPDLHLVRLQLAKLLWQLDCAPFALEQLNNIDRLSVSTENTALKELISRLGGSPNRNSTNTETSAENAKTLASLDFDIEVVEGEK